MLWSKKPWADVDAIGSPDLPGGWFISGTTEGALGPVRVIGVCIPWAASHVGTGRRDRKRWEDHLRYLEALSEVLNQQQSKFIVLGDFNQAVPRRTAPRAVFSALIASLGNKCHIVSSGEIAGCGYAIDHIAVSDGLEAARVSGLPAKGEGGAPVSDHFGLVAEIRKSNSIAG